MALDQEPLRRDSRPRLGGRALLLGASCTQQRVGALLETVKGKLTHSIDKGAPTFDMPGGPSSVVLFQLPEYQVPYNSRSKVRNEASCGPQSSSCQAVYFDDSFQLA